MNEVPLYKKTIKELKQEILKAGDISFYENEDKKEFLFRLRIGWLALKNGMSIEKIKYVLERYMNDIKTEEARNCLETDEEFEPYIDDIDFWMNHLMELRLAYLNGVDFEDIDLLFFAYMFLDEFPYSYRHFHEAFKGLEHGLSVDEVGSYAYSDLEPTPEEMREKRKKLEIKKFGRELPDNEKELKRLEPYLTKEELKNFSIFNEYQLDQIYLGFKHNLLKDDILLYAKEDIPWWKMYHMRVGLEFEYPKEKVLLYTSSKITNEEEIRAIREGIEKDLSVEQLKIVIEEAFDEEEIKEFVKAFEDGLSVKEVKFLSENFLNIERMKIARDGFKNGVTIKQMEFALSYDFDNHQFREVVEGFSSGLTLKDVKFYAHPWLDYFNMFLIKEGLKEGIPKSKLSKYLKKIKMANNEEDSWLKDWTIKELKKFLNNKKITIKELDEKGILLSKITFNEFLDILYEITSN
jgi:hypothetical protein